MSQTMICDSEMTICITPLPATGRNRRRIRPGRRSPTAPPWSSCIGAVRAYFTFTASDECCSASRSHPSRSRSSCRRRLPWRSSWSNRSSHVITAAPPSSFHVPVMAFTVAVGGRLAVGGERDLEGATGGVLHLPRAVKLAGGEAVLSRRRARWRTPTRRPRSSSSRSFAWSFLLLIEFWAPSTKV